MNELQNSFVEYIKQFVAALTKGREEFFLSLCDIEEDLLLGLDVSALEGYHVVVVDHRDYSEAVRLRNDVGIKKIVLLSGEGIKQIDSLKDFNEYSVLSAEREILFSCLEAVLQVKLEAKVRDFLNAILDQSEISFSGLLQYLLKCVETRKRRIRLVVSGELKQISHRRLAASKLNRNLPMLGIWKSKQTEVLGKGKIKRMIRTSRYSVVESRLTRAIMNHKLPDPSKESLVTESLAEGNIQKILEAFDFEEVEDLLKTGGKGPISSMTEETASSEVNYRFSYEYLLMEEAEESIEELENRLLQEKGQEEEGTSWDWGTYEQPSDAWNRLEKQFDELYETAAGLNLPPSRIIQIQDQLSCLRGEVETVWDELWEVTPVCLNRFCECAKGYSQTYLELLTGFLTDEKSRYSVCGTGMVQAMQLLFCEPVQRGIRMPFYHPVCVFYYMGIRKIYESVLASSQNGEIGALEDQIQGALVKKLGMDFPVEFLVRDGREYALDYMSVAQGASVEFTGMENGVVYSALDFGVLQRQVTDYLKKHPLLTVITVALVDISDLGGLALLVDRIQQLSQQEQCNIGRVDFLILSSREYELKRKMSQIWDAVGNSDLVRFRFGRQDYWTRDGYDIDRIVSEADLIFLADSSILYHEPRQVRERKDNNLIRNRLEGMNLEQQAEHFFRDGVSELPVVWDTLQHIAESREEGFFRWKSREMDNGLLAYINQQIAAAPDKSIVILSSNEDILSEIYRTQYIHAHRRKYNGKSITLITFESNHVCEKLPEEGEMKLTYSLKDFYHRALELEGVQKEINPELTDLLLEIRYEEGKFYGKCIAVGESAGELTDDWKERCREWMKWHMDIIPSEDNILGRYFRELQMGHWYEKTRSLPAVLMLEKLSQPGQLMLEYGTQEKERADYLGETEADCLEALKIHEMIRFAEGRAVIDEMTVSQFREWYELEMLERVLDCDSQRELLDRKERTQLIKIRDKIKGE